MISKAPFIGVPLFFGVLWIGVTTVLGLMSGWFALASQFPDRPEETLAKINGQSGTMGAFGVNFNGILNFEVCPSGLRVSVNRIFGPFSHPFFVPWDNISVERKARIIGPAAVLWFGGVGAGKLTLAGYVANRLARVSAGKWPEPGPFPRETPSQVLIGVLREWAIITVFASAFFIIAPRAMGVGSEGPPVAVAVLFPAFTFGVMSVFRYVRRVGY